MSEQPPNQPPPPPSGQPGQPYNPSPPPQQQPPASQPQQPQQPYSPPPQQPYQQPYQPPSPYQQQPGGQFGGPPVGYGAPAQLGERALARLIDGFVLLIPIIVITVVLTAVFLGGFSNGVVDYLLYGIIYSILVVALEIGYYAFMESSRGQTVGKMAMKLKTVGPDGASNPTMSQAVKRNAFYALTLISILPFAFSSWLANLAVLGAVIYIAVTINNDTVNRQGFHDHFADGTRVIKVG